MRTIKVTDGEVSYEQDMPMGALRRIMNATVSGSLEDMIEGYARFVTKWPYAGDPKDAKSWDDLKRSQFNEVTAAIVADLAELGNS